MVSSEIWRVRNRAIVVVAFRSRQQIRYTFAGIFDRVRCERLQGRNVVSRLQSGGTATLGASGPWTPDLKVRPLNLRSFMIHDSDPSKRMNRREFVLTSTAAGSRPRRRPGRRRRRPAVITRPRQAGRDLLRQRPPVQERRDEDLRRDRFRAHDRRQGRPRRPDRRRQHRRARSAGRRASATAALPNADGVVQLDSCCMHGPKKRAGGVACLEGVRTPSLVAQKVMD